MPATALISGESRPIIGRVTTGSPNALSNRETSTSPLAHNSNRKRKTTDSEIQSKQIKITFEEKSCALNGSKDTDDTEEYEVLEVDDTESTTVTDDNDCIITDAPSTDAIIDLSDDDNSDGGEGSNRMIELIMCNEMDPESSEAAGEYVIEISNDLDDLDTPQPLRVDFLTPKDKTDETVRCQGDDRGRMVLEKNVEREQPSRSIQEEQSKSVQNKNDDLPSSRIDNTGTVEIAGTNTIRDSVSTIDLTEDEINVDIEAFRAAVIKEIKRKLSTIYPAIVQSVSWNHKSNQFEVSLSKRSGFKADDTFHQHLREVVNQAIQGKKSFDLKTKYATRHAKRKPSNGQTTENVILNKEYALKRQLELLKHSDPVEVVDSSTGWDVIKPVDSNVSLPRKQQLVISYSAINQMMQKCDHYLGVSKETFWWFQNLLGGVRIRSVLILLLRKLKLNESFISLSDTLCENFECEDIYVQFLSQASCRLNKFIHWPTLDRKTLAIMNVFEIEIPKPATLMKQLMSYCNSKQRYLVKFIICCTLAGYITHISPPFHSIQHKTVTQCLEKIPEGCTAVMHPNLLKFAPFKNIKRMNSLYDCTAERNSSERVFDRLRRFSVFNNVSDWKDVRRLEHALLVIACLCNVELVKEI